MNVTKIIYLVRPTPFYEICGGWLESLAVRQWESTHLPPAPLRVKAEMLRAIARRFKLRTFVETGTFFGDTIAALSGEFDRIFTIELSPRLCARARDRFRQQPKIQVIAGDSATELPRLLPSLAEPCLFWLDGHYSGGVTAKGNTDTPIKEELTLLLGSRHQADVFLVDDARLFGVDAAYPSLGEVESLVAEARPDWGFEVIDDIIHICPPSPKTDPQSVV